MFISSNLMCLCSVYFICCKAAVLYGRCRSVHNTCFRLWVPLQCWCFCHLQSHRVHTEWRFPISGVHPIMTEKSALVRLGGSHPPPFSLLPSRTKLQCTILLRGQIHSLYFISTLYVLCVPRSNFCSPTLVTQRLSTAPIHM